MVTLFPLTSLFLSPADLKHHPEPRRRWARRIGLGFGLLVLVTSMTPRGVFGDLYGKPMWIAVNDRSFIVDFIISFYDTRIHVPQTDGALDPSLRWTVSDHRLNRSEEHTSELQSLMRISYAVFCLKKKN